ncbi:MAG: MFS transporter [Patescibacteria group bacterium]|nr:MFS transporter [Patescibacteria group bacterium]
MVHRNIKLLSWFNLFTDFKLYTGILIIYFAKVSGSFTLGMTVFSIAMVSSALFEIPTGVFSDFIGRKKTIVLGAFCAILYSVFYALGGSFFMLAIGGIFEGLSISFYSGNNDALVYDTLSLSKKENEYAEFLGRLSSFFQIALAISAILGGVIANFSFAIVMWVSIIPQIICLLIALFLKDIKNSNRSGNIYAHLADSISEFKKNEKLRLLSISSMLMYGVGEASFQFQSAFYNTLWPVWAIGFAKTSSYLGATISFRFSGKIIKKFGKIQMLIVGNIYSRVANLISLLFPTIFSPVLMSSTSLLYGTSSIARNALFQEEFKSDKRATMGSLNSFAGSIVFGIAATGLGVIADKTSPGTALLAGTLFLFIPVFIYWKLYKTKNSQITEIS